MGSDDFFAELIGIKRDPDYLLYKGTIMFGKECFMSMKSDFERIQEKNLRRRQREEGEKNLKKGLADPHEDDLMITVTANRERAENREKIDQLKRNR